MYAAARLALSTVTPDGAASWTHWQDEKVFGAKKAKSEGMNGSDFHPPFGPVEEPFTCWSTPWPRNEAEIMLSFNRAVDARAY